MTTVQFTERKEEFREKLLTEAKRLSLGENDIKAMFMKGVLVASKGLCIENRMSSDQLVHSFR